MEVPEMLTGRALGNALRAAITLKKVSQQEVAHEFGVKQSSVAEWLKFGRIHKKHLPKLVAYFSSVVGPQHWGLPPAWSVESSQLPLKLMEPPPPTPPRDFSDRREVSDSDWGLLQDIRMMMTDAELAELRARAARAKQVMAEQHPEYVGSKATAARKK